MSDASVREQIDGGILLAEYDRRYGAAVRSGAGARVEGIDQGLRAFMLGIYNNMAMGLALTGACGLRRLRDGVDDGQILTPFGQALYVAR